MKRLMFKIAGAAVGLSLCFGASASASIPVRLAPAAVQQNGLYRPFFVEIIEVIVIAISDLPRAEHALEHVDQTAQFDRTN